MHYSLRKWLYKGWYQLILGMWIGSISMALLIGRAEASVFDCKAVSQLSDEQAIVLYESYDKGVEDDLGYTLAAIAWRESSAGRYRVNYKSNDYGAYGINYKTIQRAEATTDYYKTIGFVQEVINNDELGAKYALHTLKWNLQHHKGDWRKAVMHYNAGNKWWLGEAYASDIALKVRILRTCL